jgi:hypothetical protein
MLLKDFGPFPGMTYLGRQNIDAIAMDAAATSKAALIRLVERQSDTVSDETTVVPGNAAYAEEWKRRDFASSVFKSTCIALTAAVTTGLVVTKSYDLVAMSTSPEIVGRGVFAFLIFVIGATAFMANLFVAIRVLRLGYGRELPQAFRQLAAEAWIIGDNALYVSFQGASDKRPLAKTVFYDAIGTVDTEQTGEGLDRLVVRSRDGSHIADMLAPVTAATDNAFDIVHAINARLAD